jgi:hypothetical protein
MSNKIISVVIPVTPKEMYMRLVEGTYESIRNSSDTSNTYIPAQFGGIFGQGAVLRKGITMEITTFKVK